MDYEAIIKVDIIDIYITIDCDNYGLVAKTAQDVLYIIGYVETHMKLKKEKEKEESFE